MVEKAKPCLQLRAPQVYLERLVRRLLKEGGPDVRRMVTDEAEVDTP